MNDQELKIDFLKNAAWLYATGADVDTFKYIRSTKRTHIFKSGDISYHIPKKLFKVK